MTCRNCGYQATRGEGFWICLNCEWKIEDAAQSSAPPADVVDALPHAIALPVLEYFRASRGYEKLHRLTDAAELLTRFCAAVVLADLLDRGPDHTFPEKVQEALLDRLERPTFGAWAGLLETAVKTLPRLGGKIQCVVPELPAIILDKLLPLLGSNHTPPEDGIVALRNVLAHSGRLSGTDERRFLNAHARRFEEFIEDASFFAKVQVVGSPAPGKVFLLHGVPLPGTSFPEFDLRSLPSEIAPPRPDRLLLVAGNRAIDLFPMHAYGDVFHYLDKTREEVRATGKTGTDPRANFEPVPEASPATLLYFRRGAKDYLEYTSLSPYAAHSQEGFAALERFRQVFQLEQWRRNAEARQGRKEFDFADWRKELLELFVGRGDQVRQVADWARQANTGICWISGHPGVGKSAFMADLAERFFRRRQALLQGGALLSGRGPALQPDGVSGKCADRLVGEFRQGGEPGGRPAEAGESVPAATGGIREGGEELLRKALEFGHLMLKRVTITEQRNVGEEGEPYTAPAYVLYHESFRDHLLATDTVKNAVRAAQTSLVRFSVVWNEHCDRLASYRYALRFGPVHLKEQNQSQELFHTLTDPTFVEAKCAAGLLNGLVMDYQFGLDLAARGETRELSVTSDVCWSSSQHGDGTTKKAGSARGVVDSDWGAAREREPSVLRAVESDLG